MDPFFKDLQNQCLNDCEEHINGFRASLVTLADSPNVAVGEMLKVMHTVKGNLQAAGFQFFGAFLHDFESVLLHIQTQIQQTHPAEASLGVLEFMLSDVSTALTIYARTLAEGAEDTLELKQAQSGSLALLASWKAATPPAVSAFVVEATAEPTAQLVEADAPAAATAETTPVSTETSTNPTAENSRNGLYLLCRNKQHEFAVSVSQVREIVQHQTWFPVPGAPAHVLGAIRLRGLVIPILNLRSVLGGLDSQARPVIVICELGADIFGVPASSVDRVAELTAFQTVEGLSAQQQPETVASIDDQPILILDVERFIPGGARV